MSSWQAQGARMLQLVVREQRGFGAEVGGPGWDGVDLRGYTGKAEEFDLCSPSET